MRKMHRRSLPQSVLFLGVLLLLACGPAALAQQAPAIRLEVDATGAPRGVLRTRLRVPASPGPLTLFYPKWIPGEHAPTGPLNNLVGLKLAAGGRALQWERDRVEMFAFNCQVPAGANGVEVEFEDVAEPETTATARLARIKWNRLVLYPRGMASDAVRVVASLRLPPGWKYATALPVTRESGGQVEFGEVSLETLVDSPAVIGANFRTYALSTGAPLHEMDVAADSASALELKPETLRGVRNLVSEAGALFGARHYESYRFLVTLSDHGGSEGLEHHQSSEDGVGERAFSDPAGLLDLGDLLGHEYAHSWNGKYRRPAGLATPDFERPMTGELLWVYEGLTEYLGKVLPTRSGLWTAANFREAVANVAADMDHRAGRDWRPLLDTAVAVQFTYSSPSAWRSIRRRVDYYDEGLLLWMEADVLIRQRSQGRRSLDDFCHRFHGGQSGAPAVRPYTLEDVVAALNEVEPDDWRGFLTERVERIRPHPPLAGITEGGWRLVYTEEPNEAVKVTEQLRKLANFNYSLGLLLKDDGTVVDVNPRMAAGQAGLVPGMKLLGVNGRSFSPEALHEAVKATKNGAAPLELLVEQGSFHETYRLDYHGGERYPHLERDASRPDLLSEIIKPRARS